jgi:hypothetical protein
MLKTLQFDNYRCFPAHSFPLKKETIIVGRNNAGKSTIIEGFRLVGIITERFKNLNFHDVHGWLDLSDFHRGVRIDLSGLSFSWENLFHRYQPPPASVIATFENGCKVEIYLGPEQAMYCVSYDSDDRIIRTKAQARSLSLPKVSVLPEVMPLTRAESILRSDYVRANLSTRFSSLHFRNQLALFYDEYFAHFKSLVESSWPGLQIIELQADGTDLGLLVRDGDFVAEIAWMGDGFRCGFRQCGSSLEPTEKPQSFWTNLM